MKTQEIKKSNRLIKGLLIGLAIIIAIPFCLGMYAGITSHTGTTGAIVEALETECDCQDIDFDHSAYGIQFSRTDGLTGKKAAYSLKGCTFETNAQDLVAKFNRKMVTQLDGYTELDVIHYQFFNADSKEVITIKNGIIQEVNH